MPLASTRLCGPKRSHSATYATTSRSGEGYCTTHYTELIRDKVRPEAYGGKGIGLQFGPLRPDYGPGIADLQCTCCDATWTGLIGERCTFCSDNLEVQRNYQVELILRRPDMDRTDVRYPAALEAWAIRLANAVNAGRITLQQ
ncbi:MAG TPA: hypothetical protein PLV68_03270, partial [Ilumatobacteraceae bacterium]|nr:hypothetical protein [Ilumatobacteraceae bacterium]